MGGSGSGRRGYLTKTTAENCHKVDANSLARWEFFKPGGRNEVSSWSGGRNETGSVGIRTSIDNKRAICVFQYNCKEITVNLSWFSPGYGGRRYFFICPECGKRMRTLFFKKSKIACRLCHNLTYESSNHNYYFDSAYKWMASNTKIPWEAVKVYMRLKMRAAKKEPKRPRGRPRKVRTEVA